eukprot:3396458-Pleurochrysis_carterae.AAC.1
MIAKTATFGIYISCETAVAKSVERSIDEFLSRATAAYQMLVATNIAFVLKGARLPMRAAASAV